MSDIIHIANAFIVNEQQISKGDVLIRGEIIQDISIESSLTSPPGAKYVDASGLFLLPGIIDDQVHFREPGLTQKGDIFHESRAAVAGGVTSYMEMPNTKPPATTLELLEEKYQVAQKNSIANFSFYIGVTNENHEEVLKTPLDSVCGLKIFLGSSTGNLLVNNYDTLEIIFKKTPHIVAVHCEEDEIIEKNISQFTKQYGKNIPVGLHHRIRSSEACLVSSSRAVELAKKHNTRLHILHISTEDELSLLDQTQQLENKRITGEVCVHHLWFTSDDYEKFGTLIKWNPAIKEKHHREALRKSITNGLIDIVATDHAPHLFEEKHKPYLDAPSGAPIIQFSLLMMLELVKQKVVSLTDVVRLMCHNPARLFQIRQRGFIRKGWFADLTLIDLNTSYLVENKNIYSKCGWSPLEGTVFGSEIKMTLINGKIAFENGQINEDVRGKRLFFDRNT